MPRKTQNLCNNFSEFALWIRFELFNTEASLHLLLSARRSHAHIRCRKFDSLTCFVGSALALSVVPSLSPSLPPSPSLAPAATHPLSFCLCQGRISRYLANKCSIASRIDCFSEVCVCARVRACVRVCVRACVRACVWKSQTVVVGCLGSLAFFLHPSHPHPHALNRHRAQSSARR